MKKNNGRKVALLTALVLIVTLVSTSLLGGTLAKYVTGYDVEATARVAKWGVEIEVDTTDNALFHKTYDSETTGYTGLAVESDAFVVAPGTTGSLKFTIKGTPEVAFELAFDKGTSQANGWTLKDGDGDDYEPVVWSLNGTEIGTFDELLDELEDSTVFDVFAPGTTVNEAITISWEWPFYVSDANDLLDTEYGNMTALPSFDVDFAFTATQVD